MPVPDINGSWNYLIDGNITKAVYHIYDSTITVSNYSGIILVILYLVFTFITIIKTKSYTGAFFVGLVFLALFHNKIPLSTIPLIITILSILLGLILYNTFFDNK